MAREKHQVLEDLERRAVERFPDLTRPQAVQRFIALSEGARLYEEYRRAPGPNVAPKAASPATSAAADQIFDRAVQAFPNASTKHEALVAYLRTAQGRQDYAAYRGVVGTGRAFEDLPPAA